MGRLGGGEAVGLGRSLGIAGELAATQGLEVRHLLPILAKAEFGNLDTTGGSIKPIVEQKLSDSLLCEPEMLSNLCLREVVIDQRREHLERGSG